MTRPPVRSSELRHITRLAAKSCRFHFRAKWALFIAVAFVTLPLPVVLGQGVPQITAVSPASGAVGAMITITGKNLEKTAVSGVYLSDQKTDHKARMVSQSADKIVMAVPHVKPGDYNVSFQEGSSIYIQPVRFVVKE